MDFVLSVRLYLLLLLQHRHWSTSYMWLNHTNQWQSLNTVNKLPTLKQIQLEFLKQSRFFPKILSYILKWSSRSDLITRTRTLNYILFCDKTRVQMYYFLIYPICLIEWCFNDKQGIWTVIKWAHVIAIGSKLQTVNI